ncbi:MAG: PAS domain S-box protein [Woeseiaceae bacterium]|nr:PAS domain S-box protein [Woeseiaceae bacterium]
MTAVELPADVSMQLLHAAPDAAVVSNSEGEIIYANRKAELLFGFEPGEMIGKPIETLMPESRRNKHVELRDAFGAHPHARPLLSGMELLAQRKGGDRFRAEIALLPVESADGLLVASTVREIDAPMGSESYFRTLLETAPDAMVIVDSSGRIAIVNSQTEQMFGYSRRELLGNPIEMLLPERIREQHERHRAKYLEAPSLRPMGQGLALLGRRKDGEEFPVEISLSPVESENGRFISSTIRDVTERARMERAIIAAQEEAERANKANTAFLAAASHDLRQPVQALSLLNGALRRTVKDERALSMIDSQENSLTAMTNLLNSLLDISRLDAGAIAPEIEEFPVSKVIDRLAAEFGRQAQHKGLKFSAQSCPTVIRSDVSLLGEILQNLVSNAIRYTEEGEVRLTCSHDADVCRLKVTDTGVGIEEDELESIFLEFNQGSSKTATKEGFGLGLAIVRRLADLLDIRVSVESTVGKGSSFALEISTLGDQDIEDDEDEQTESLMGSTGLVLLVEDNVNVADAWAMLLEAEGYTVERAISATEVEEVISGLTRPPALVITDYHLADNSTGVEVIKLVRGHFDSDLPAFIVSGDTSKVVTDARPVENCQLFSKPINTDELLDAARDAVETGLVP